MAEPSRTELDAVKKRDPGVKPDGTRSDCTQKPDVSGRQKDS